MFMIILKLYKSLVVEAFFLLIKKKKNYINRVKKYILVQCLNCFGKRRRKYLCISFIIYSNFKLKVKTNGLNVSSIYCLF